MDNFALKRSRSMGFDDSHRPAEMIQANKEEAEARAALERVSVNDPASSVSSADDDTDNHEVSSVSSPELDASEDASTPKSSAGTDPNQQPTHDDSDVHYEPSRHVDYLSHDWKESDISSSWRYIVLRRKEVANSARLENASWRTWAKAKYNLKTVSPESVNWLKDYDVTWLYGPLCRTSSQANISGGQETPKAVDDSNATETGTKPILKKRSATEMILALPPMRRSKDDTAVTPAAIAAAGDDKDKVVKSYFRHHQYRQKNPYGMTDEEVDTLADKLNAQYKLPPKSSGTSGAPSTNTSNNSSAVSSAAPSRGEPEAPPPTAEKVPAGALAPAAPVEKPKRRIHFNSEVQQCISLDYVSTDEEQYDSDDSSDDSESDEMGEDDDDEPGLFLMVRSSSSASVHRPELGGMARADQPGSQSQQQDEDAVDDGHRAVKTIAPMPPTSLKYAYDEDPMDTEANAVATVHSAVSHNNSRRRDYAHYDYNSVYQAPVSNSNNNINNSSSNSNNSNSSNIIPRAPYMESPANSLTPSPVGSPEGSPKSKYMDILEQVKQAQAALAAQPFDKRNQEAAHNDYDKSVYGTVEQVATLDGLVSDDEPVMPHSPPPTKATTATTTTSTSTENVCGLIDEGSKEDRPKAFRTASTDSNSSTGSNDKRLFDKAKDMASNFLGWGSGGN